MQHDMARVRRERLSNSPDTKSIISFILQRTQEYTRQYLEELTPSTLQELFEQIPPTRELAEVTKVEYDPLRAQDGRLNPHRRGSAARR